MSGINRNKEVDRSVPNWLVFLFFGSLIAGALYVVFMHGFLKYDNAKTYRDNAGIQYVTAAVAEMPAKNAASIADGKALALSRCAACHGAGLVGVPGNGPSLMDATWKNPMDGEKSLFLRIKKGVPGTGMPPGGLLSAPSDMWKVVFYLSSVNKSIKQEIK